MMMKSFMNDTDFKQQQTLKKCPLHVAFNSASSCLAQAVHHFKQ